MLDLHLHVPWLSECMNQVRTFGCKLIVHLPGGGQLACTTLNRRLQREETDDVPRVCVEHLLVSSIGRRTDSALHAVQIAKILDVRQHNIGGATVKGTLVILTTSLGSYVC